MNWITVHWILTALSDMDKLNWMHKIGCIGLYWENWMDWIGFNELDQMDWIGSIGFNGLD